MYRDASIGPMVRWDKAHNTYLELLQGLGIPAATILIAAVGSLVWLCVSGAISRRRFVTAPLAASAATAAVLLHAFVDFSLQMQAVAITWMALLGRRRGAVVVEPRSNGQVKAHATRNDSVQLELSTGRSSSRCLARGASCMLVPAGA